LLALEAAATAKEDDKPKPKAAKPAGKDGDAAKACA
jgi:hypothetical protein